MRIETQITTPDTAGRAPRADRAPGASPTNLEWASAYDELLAMLGVSLEGAQGGATGRTGPLGIAEVASRELRDPLGLATRTAAVSPPDRPLLNAPATRAGEARGAATPEVRGESSQHVTTRRGGSESPGSGDGAKGARSESWGARRGGNDGGSESRGGAHQDAASEGERSGTRGVDAPFPGRARAGGPVGPVAAGSAGVSGAPGASASGPSGGVSAIGGVNGAAVRTSGARRAAPSPSANAQHLRMQQAEIAPQIAKGLASLVLKEGGRAQIQLRPEALGRVEVDLSIRDGVVNATMSAENETARDLLNSELDRLRALLERRGLRVEKLEIVSDPAEPEARGGTDPNRGSRWTSAQAALLLSVWFRSRPPPNPLPPLTLPAPAAQCSGVLRWSESTVSTFTPLRRKFCTATALPLAAAM